MKQKTVVVPVLVYYHFLVRYEPILKTAQQNQSNAAGREIDGTHAL